MRLVLAVASGAAAIGLAALTSPVGAVPLAELDTATPIGAERGLLAYSRRGADGRFHLVVREHGVVRELPVAAREVPFDVDLGPGPEGRTWAVYSRCRTEPTIDRGALPVYARGRGCDLFRFDFELNRESSISGASTAQASEFLPSVWRGRIAFARVYESRPGDRGVYPYLYVRVIGLRSTSQRQPGGARGSTGLPGPYALDLYGRWLGFNWRYEGRGEGTTYEMRLDTTGGHRRRLARGSTGISRDIFNSAAFEDGRFYFRETCAGDPGPCGARERYWRYRLRTGAFESARADRFVAATTRDGSTTFSVLGTNALFDVGCDEQGGCSLVEHADLQWVGDAP